MQPGSVALFKFFRGGHEVSHFQTRWANSICVINQEYVPIWLAPDTYQVFAVFEEPVSIGGTLTHTRQLPDLIVHH